MFLVGKRLFCASSYIESQVLDNPSLVTPCFQIFDDQAPIRGSHTTRPTLTPCDNQKVLAIYCYHDSVLPDHLRKNMV